jgi:osmotically-inducible protein OsmY
MAQDQSYDRPRGWRGGNEEEGGYGQRGIQGGDYGGRAPRYGRALSGSAQQGNVEYRAVPGRDEEDRSGRSMDRGTGDPSYGGAGGELYEPMGHKGRGPKGYRRSDERVYEDVSERLTEHDQIDASGIEVRVENGEVTLEGTVENRSLKRLAEDVVESIPGVKDVLNRLRIDRPDGPVPAGQAGARRELWTGGHSLRQAQREEQS